MLLIAKLVALGIAVWFYMAAIDNKQAPFKWAVIGLIGYTIVWFLVYKVIAVPLSTGKSAIIDFIIHQIPALAGFFSAHLIRKKLIKEAAGSTK